MTRSRMFRNLALPAVPLTAATVYLLSGPHAPDRQLWAVLVAAALSGTLWALLDGGKAWTAGRLGAHAAAAAVSGSIAWSYFAWLHAELPASAFRAVLRLPVLVAGLINWLQVQYGEPVGLVPIAAPVVAVLATCFALVQAGRLVQGASLAEKGRKRAKSSLYGSARFMPQKNTRKLSRVQGGLILGAEDKSPGSRLVSYPLAGAALIIAPPRTGKTATVALNLLRPGGAGFGGSTIVVDPRGELWCVTARRRMAMGRRVLLLDPFGVVRRLKEEWPALEGLPADSVRWIPLDFVREGPDGVGDLDVLLDALLTPPTSQADAARHFYDAGRTIIGGFLAWVRFGPGLAWTARGRSRLHERCSAGDG